MPRPAPPAGGRPAALSRIGLAAAPGTPDGAGRKVEAAAGGEKMLHSVISSPCYSAKPGRSPAPARRYREKTEKTMTTIIICVAMLAILAGVAGYWCQPRDDRAFVGLAAVYITLSLAVLAASPEVGRPPPPSVPVASRRRKWQNVFDDAAGPRRDIAAMCYRKLKNTIEAAEKYIVKSTVQHVARNAEMTKKDMRQLARDDRRTKAGKAVVTIDSAMWHLEEVARLSAEFHSARVNCQHAIDADRQAMNFTGSKSREIRKRSRLPDDLRFGGGYRKEMYPGWCADLLERLRREEIEGNIDAGEHGYAEASWVRTMRECWVKVDSTERHDVYAGRYKGWACTERKVTVFAQQLPYFDLPGGVRAPGGMMTLGAERVPIRRHGWAGVVMWRAAWARKGRGINYRTVTGTIAQCASTGAVYHLDHPGRASKGDYEAAAKGLRRKVGRLGASRASQQEVERVAKDDSFPVTMSVARDAGLCRTGILDFAAKYLPDLDPSRDSVPLGRVVRLLRAAKIYEYETQALVGLVNHRRRIGRIHQNGETS